MRLHLLAPVLPLLFLTGGCLNKNCAYEDRAGAAVPNAPVGNATTASASRAIAEADIVQLSGGTLYAMSKGGTLSVVDVSKPGALTMLGQISLSGQPFEMYQRGTQLVTMTNSAVSATGVRTPAGSDTAPPDANGGSEVDIIDVSDPAHMTTVATAQLPGEIADSRIVGQVLYLATYQNGSCFNCDAKPLTVVTSLDLSDTTMLRQVDQISFGSSAPVQASLAWGSAWKRSIVATDERLYVGGHADVDPSTAYSGNVDDSVEEGIIDVLDITDPRGKLVVGAHLTVAGAVLSRWQMDERDGILRVISQHGAGYTGNGTANPLVETFTIDSTQKYTPLGRTSLTLPRQEGLRTVRFDAQRAYAITYNQTDPLFIIDLADPKAPAQRGELAMPGFMYYLEPYGDRVIGLGIDRSDAGGSLNVSLFDVSNADAPTMLRRVPFATPNISEDYEILAAEVAEDQDRIQKAFKVLANGLVVVPFGALRAPGASDDACANIGGGVEVVKWSGDTLAKVALLPLPGNPRRALENGSELLAVSDSNVRAFSMLDLEHTDAMADLVIGTCVPPQNLSYGGALGGGWEGGGGYFGDDGCR